MSILKNLHIIFLILVLVFAIYIYMYYMHEYMKKPKIENFETFDNQTRQTILELEPTKKIAFCFLIYDKINHLELWEKFF